MKKFLNLLTASLLFTGQLFASHSDCFRPYSVSLANQSGGVAEVKKTKGIRGLSRKSEILNNTSVRIIIQKRGAEIEVTAGPEGSKSERDIKFYSKDHRNFRPTAILSQKGVTVNGFSTKPVTFSVKIENNSEGTARIIDTCDASGKGASIANGKSTSITAHPLSHIIVEAGPEKQKTQYKITFADQRGESPTVVLGQRGFFSSGVQGKNIDLQVRRAPMAHTRAPRLTAVTSMKKMEKMEKPAKKMSRGMSRRKAYKMKNVQEKPVKKMKNRRTK